MECHFQDRLHNVFGASALGLLVLLSQVLTLGKASCHGDLPYAEAMW